MREIENYELVVSGDQEEKLLLTFDWADIPNLPSSAVSAKIKKDDSSIRVVFEDDKRWEEIVFLRLPFSLQEMMVQFDKMFVVGLSDEVELCNEVPLSAE